jgi:O-antigen/teichoic acid export membrane protein
MSYEKFAKDVGLIGITRVLLTGLTGLILLPLLTKTIGAHDYGLWVQVTVTVSLLQALVFFGLPNAMVRFLAAEKDKKKIREGFYSIVFFVLFISLILSLGLILFPEKLADNFFDGAIDIVRITGLIILVHNLGWACFCFFRTFSEMKVFSFFIILENIGLIVLVFYFITAGYRIVGAVISLLFMKFLIFSVLFFMILLRIGIELPNFSQLKEFLRFGLPTVPGNISNWIITSADRYLIGYFMGAAFIGYYSSGYLLGDIISMFSGVLVFVLTPTLSKLYDEQKVQEVKIHLSYSIKYFLMLGIPFFFGTLLLSKPLLSILTTQEIASASFMITPLIALGAILRGMSFIIMQVFILTKKTKIIGFIWVVSAFINFFLNILLIPYFGILGAALATLISYLVAFSLFTIYCFKYFAFTLDKKFITKSVLAAFLMGIILLKLNQTYISNILITLLMGIVIYFSVLFSLKGFSKKEIKFFKKLIKKID